MSYNPNSNEALDRAFPPKPAELIQEEQCDLLEEVLKELKSVNKTLAIVAQALVRVLERKEVSEPAIKITSAPDIKPADKITFGKGKQSATRPKKTT